LKYIKNVFVDKIKLVFTKDDLAITVTCFTEKRWIGTLNPLDYSISDIAKTCL